MKAPKTERSAQIMINKLGRIYKAAWIAGCGVSVEERNATLPALQAAREAMFAYQALAKSVGFNVSNPEISWIGSPTRELISQNID